MPAVAERQDWPLCRAIIDYRNALIAMDLFQRGHEGIKQLEAQPQLGRLILAMRRAQGDSLGMVELYAEMRNRAINTDDDEGGTG